MPHGSPSGQRGAPRGGRLAALLLALCLHAVAGAQDGTRVGFVDMQRLIDTAPQILAARERLQVEFAARDQRLRGDEAQLAELERDLRAAADSDDPAAAEDLRRQRDALQRSVERTRERLRSELDARSEEEVDRAWPQINEAVAELAREEGFDLIVPSPVVYVSGRIDITDRVLDRLRRNQSDGADNGDTP
jgi:outer membrane protein